MKGKKKFSTLYIWLLLLLMCSFSIAFCCFVYCIINILKIYAHFNFIRSKKNFFFFRTLMYALKARYRHISECFRAVITIFFPSNFVNTVSKIEQTYPNMISLSSCRDFVLVALTYVSLCYSRHFTIVYLSISTWMYEKIMFYKYGYGYCNEAHNFSPSSFTRYLYIYVYMDKINMFYVYFLFCLLLNVFLPFISLLFLTLLIIHEIFIILEKIFFFVLTGCNFFSTGVGGVRE